MISVIPDIEGNTKIFGTQNNEKTLCMRVFHVITQNFKTSKNRKYVFFLIN